MDEGLLLEIARCPVVQQCLATPDSDHPCATIVNLQQADSYAEHQVPEPWSGHLANAPILFISSNPSISDEEVFPTGNWSDQAVVDYFENRFGGGREEWIRDGMRTLAKDGNYLRATMFWAAVRQRAIELFERDVVPGVDYALTEIVHCKSRAERGVAEALEHCKARYFRRVVESSSARVLVVLGSLAKEAVIAELGLASDANVCGPAEFFGRKRIVAFLPHPNARAKRTFAACMAPEELETIRLHLCC